MQQHLLNRLAHPSQADRETEGTQLARASSCHYGPLRRRGLEDVEEPGHRIVHPAGKGAIRSAWCAAHGRQSAGHRR